MGNQLSAIGFLTMTHDSSSPSRRLPTSDSRLRRRADDPSGAPAQGLATVDEQRRARDVPRLVRRQKGDRGGDILWLADSTERNPIREFGEKGRFVTRSC